MSLYTRYVSGEHDKEHFKAKQRQISHRGKKTNPNDQVVKESIQLPFFNDDSDDYTSDIHDQNKLLLTWLHIFQRAAIFVGYDDLMFNHVVSIVYQAANKNKLSTQSITKFGLASYPNLKLDSNSRFWPSCENLIPQHQKSHVRQALAILNLKNSNRMLNHHHLMQLPMWDETNAGTLASAMTLVQNKSPEDVGKKLAELGLVQNQKVCSFTVDVIYDNDNVKDEIVEENNLMVSLLGEQLDQIFNSLLEYAPEEIKSSYMPSMGRNLVHFLNSKIQSILDELINVQTNYTAGLVNLLQTFIIPLRISVMGHENVNSSSAIQKINQIFPPTIDEITRVNCLLNDALLKARKVDDVEIIVAMGTIMPYFYKPFIRHEANVKHFNDHLTKFAQKYKKSIFENREINSSQYTVREIDSIVTGALLELPKFKLLLQRLHEAIEFEEIQLRNFDTERSTDTLRLINLYYESAMDVIYAFSGADEQKVEAKRRVFTPTGRMLTEIAGNWPPELQFDWNSRKIVGIFQLQNVASTNTTGSEILVVFSDYLLFFTVEDGNAEADNDNGKKLSVADALMHSLVNEKPMPNLDTFPAMQVTAWCRIDEVLVTKYSALNEKNTEIDCLRFLSLNSNGFSSSTNKARTFARNYKATVKSVPVEDIIIAVEKSKILHKSSSFHLFKSINNDMNISYTAQSISDYKTEIFKLPFALILNMDIDVPSYFDEHPQLLLLLQASMINDDQMRVTGYDKCSKEQINDIIESKQLSSFLEQVVKKTFRSLFSTYNSVTHNVIEGNSWHLKYLVDYYLTDRIDSEKQNSIKPKSTNTDQSKVKQSSNHHNTPSKPLSSRSSILSKIHLKKTKKSTTKTREPKPKRNVSNTFIPQGTKLEYKEIYKPVPTLQKREMSSASTVIENKTERPSEGNKRCTSIPSIDVSPNFQFPLQIDNNLDEIETNAVASNNHETSTIKRLSTMDDISMVLKMSQEPSFVGDYFYDEYDLTPNWEYFNMKNESGGNMFKQEIIGTNLQWGNIGDLVEIDEKAVINSAADEQNSQVQHSGEGVNRGAVLDHHEPNSLAHEVTERSQFDPPFSMFIPNTTNTRKPSNESLIFSQAARTPTSFNTFATPPLSNNTEGLLSTHNTYNNYSKPIPHKQVSRIPRDESAKSISAHEYAIEFSRLIDAEFSKPPLDTAIDSLSSTTTAKTPMLSSPSTTSLTPFHTNSSVVTLVSNSSNNAEVSEEEACSSTEDQEGGIQAQPVLHKELKSTQETLIASNVFNNMHLSETTTKPLNEYMRDDSISQLTNLLQNSIKFNDFNIEMFR